MQEIFNSNREGAQFRARQEPEYPECPKCRSRALLDFTDSIAKCLNCGAKFWNEQEVAP